MIVAPGSLAARALVRPGGRAGFIDGLAARAIALVGLGIAVVVGTSAVTTGIPASASRLPSHNASPLSGYKVASTIFGATLQLARGLEAPRARTKGVGRRVLASREMSAPAGFSNTRLTFDDSFAGTTLNTSHWRTYISDASSGGWPWNDNGAGGSGINAGSYDAEYFQPSAVSVNNGLSITATKRSPRPGYSWTSGVVSTYGLVSISKGYVQVRAWMPNMTTGMWPGIWLMGAKSELPEIDLFEGGNTPNANGDFAANLHAPGDTQQIVQSGTVLAAGWHTYGMDYEPGKSITYYLDGRQLARYTSNVPSGPYFLILDLQVAQNTSGWHSVVGSSTPTSVMRVAEVQMYS